MHGVRDGPVRDANNYEQQEQASSRSSVADRLTTQEDHQLSIRDVDVTAP